MSTVARTMSATKIQKDILFEFKASTVKYGVDFRLIPLELGLVWFFSHSRPSLQELRAEPES